MSYEEILQQLKDYVFSDEDPRHCAERYLEILQIPAHIQLNRPAAIALNTISEEFMKTDTPKGRANMVALLRVLNEKRQAMFEKVVTRFGQDQGILLSPEVVLEGTAMQAAVSYVVYPLTNIVEGNDELWQTICSEQNIDIQENPSINAFAIVNPKKKEPVIAKELGLEEIASKVEALGIPVADPDKLDKHPLTLPDNQTVKAADYYAACDNIALSKASPAMKNLYKHWLLTPQYADFIDPVYRDIGQADLKPMTPEQRGAYLTMMEDLRAMGRYLEDSTGPRTIREKTSCIDYASSVLSSAENFLKKTRDSGPELNAVKAGVYGLMLQLGLPTYETLKNARKYLTPDTIQAGQENAQRYSHFHKKEKLSLDVLQEDAPPAPTPKSLWTQEDDALFHIRVRDTKMDPGMKAVQEETRRNFLTLCEKAKQTGDGSLPENMAETLKALRKETPSRTVSMADISGPMSLNRQAIESAWDKEHLVDGMTYQKLLQMRDLNRMLKKTDPTFHINSSEFRNLKTAMGDLFEMTSRKGFTLNDEKTREAVGEQMKKIRETAKLWLAKENVKTERTNDTRYGMVLGILGAVDPAEAENSLAQNKAPLKLYGDDLKSKSYRENGKYQTKAEKITHRIQMISGSRYAGKTELQHQASVAKAIELDKKLAANRQKKSVSRTESLADITLEQKDPSKGRSRH